MEKPSKNEMEYLKEYNYSIWLYIKWLEQSQRTKVKQAPRHIARVSKQTKEQYIEHLNKRFKS